MPFRFFYSTLALFLVLGNPSFARAQDGDGDRGSRAVRQVESGTDDETAESEPGASSQTKSTLRTQTTRKNVKSPRPTKKKEKGRKKKKKKKKRRKDKLRPYFEYALGAFAGVHPQKNEWGPFLSAQVGGGAESKIDSVGLDLSYDYEPFSTKTYNFPEEQNSTPLERLTQPLHDLSARFRRKHRWSSWIESRMQLRADLWLPKLKSDERRAIRWQPQLQLGKKRGTFGNLSTGVFYKVFPKYHVNDRRLDQVGLKNTAEAGYTFAPYTRVGVGSDLIYTFYLDARYSMLNTDGSITRATKSKTYVELSPYVYGSWRPVKAFRGKLRYARERNNSVHYWRRMTGRVKGDLVAKLIPDYYDYLRHRWTLTTHSQPIETLELSTLAEAWLRHFDTYEARDANNEWLGVLREDFSMEFALEANLNIGALRAAGAKHDLYVSLFGSHLRRRSNMKRQASLLTNFDVTRVFAGFEIRTM